LRCSFCVKESDGDSRLANIGLKETEK